MNDAQIESLISDAHEPDSINNLTVRDIREWLKGYLDAYAEGLAEFPEQEGDPHWDVNIADYDRNKSALFVCALFDKEKVNLLAGTGNGEVVRDLCDRGFPVAPLTILENINQRFPSGQVQLKLSLREVMNWLG